MTRSPYLRHRPMAANQMTAIETLAACARLEAAGCRIQAAAVTAGAGRITVDRRPPLPDLAAGCLRCDAAGAHYVASLDGVRVTWREARQRPPRTAMGAGERVAVGLGWISGR